MYIFNYIKSGCLWCIKLRVTKSDTQLYSIIDVTNHGEASDEYH